MLKTTRSISKLLHLPWLGPVPVCKRCNSFRSERGWRREPVFSSTFSIEALPISEKDDCAFCVLLKAAIHCIVPEVFNIPKSSATIEFAHGARTFNVFVGAPGFPNRRIELFILPGIFNSILKCHHIFAGSNRGL